MILAKASPRIRLNEHVEGDGARDFRHAYKLGLGGSLSKQKVSLYRSGRVPEWLKSKNPNTPASKREAEEDWAVNSSALCDDRSTSQPTQLAPLVRPNDLQPPRKRPLRTNPAL
jgi:hypothetical protein